MPFITGIEIIIQKNCITVQKTKNSQRFIVSKNHTAESISPPDIKSYYRALVTKVSRYRHKKQTFRSTNRIEDPDFFFKKNTMLLQKTNFFSKYSKDTGQFCSYNI